MAAHMFRAARRYGTRRYSVENKRRASFFVWRRRFSETGSFRNTGVRIMA
jgi:hypothetical protein